MADPYKEFQRRTARSRAIHQETGQSIALEVVGTVDMPHPVYLVEGNGSRVRDVDGNEYVDLSMGFGPHVLGHAHPAIVKAVQEASGRGVQFGIHTPYQKPLADLIINASAAAELVMFCNSGTEATMYAIRAARAHTDKMRVGVFEGAYHGAHDAVLVHAEDGSPRTHPRIRSTGAGIPPETLDQILLLPYRDETALSLVTDHADELAAVIIEPVQGSNPTLEAGPFLGQLAEVCRRNGIVLIFDEIITGFRLAYGGAQEEFGTIPDLVTYGKAVGGGLPIGVVAGRSEIMERFDWLKHDRNPGQVFAGGTFGGNPLSMAAGVAAVGYLNEHREVYETLAGHGRRLSDEIGDFCRDRDLPAQVMAAHSMIHLRFQRGQILTARDVDRSLAEAEREFYVRLLLEGVLVPGDHLALTSAAHTDDDMTIVVDGMEEALRSTGGLGASAS